MPMTRTAVTATSSGRDRLGRTTCWPCASSHTTATPAATLRRRGTHSAAGPATRRPAAVSAVHSGEDEADSNRPATTPQVASWDSRSAIDRWMAASSRA